MSSVIRDLIEYNGIETDIPLDVLNTKVIQLDDSLDLTCEKPDIRSISKVNLRVNISSGRIIKSANLHSLDGNKLQGFKYVVEIIATWRIEYIAEGFNDTLFSVTGESSLNAFTNLSSDYKYGLTVIPSIFIDDINVELLGKRKILLSFTGLLMVENN